MYGRQIPTFFLFIGAPRLLFTPVLTTSKNVDPINTDTNGVVVTRYLTNGVSVSVMYVVSECQRGYAQGLVWSTGGHHDWSDASVSYRIVVACVNQVPSQWASKRPEGSVPKLSVAWRRRYGRHRNINVQHEEPHNVIVRPRRSEWHAFVSPWSLKVFNMAVGALLLKNILFSLLI